MSGTKIIRFLSASDRLNYGDLLFPIIFKNKIKSLGLNFEFINYAIVRSDFQSFEALYTKSYKELELDLQENDKVVIGGGEVLFANWIVLYSFINPYYRFMLKYSFWRKLENKLQLSKNILSRNKIEIPFCFSASEFGLNSLRIYYSSVGSGIIRNTNSNYICNCLIESKLITVRDNRSLKNLKKCDVIKPILIPDSALIMSDFFSLKDIGIKCEQSLNFKPYIFVQVGLYKSPKNIKKFVSQLKQIKSHLKLDIILCPIGIAPGHEDDIYLKRLYDLDPINFTLIKPKNIFEIMFLIANSNLYFGTSLHGAITAMSYGVPCIGLNKSITKMESYLKTWIDSKYYNIDCDSFEIEDLLNLISLYKIKFSVKKLNYQKQLVHKNLEYIINE